MAETFAEKFERVLEERREKDPQFGLKTLARQLAKGDPAQTEIIRRRLQKYRPKPSSGGAAKVTPTEPTRREIERALGLPVDALKTDEAAAAAQVDDAMIAAIRQIRDGFAKLDRVEAMHRDSAVTA